MGAFIIGFTVGSIITLVIVITGAMMKIQDNDIYCDDDWEQDIREWREESLKQGRQDDVSESEDSDNGASGNH